MVKLIVVIWASFETILMFGFAPTRKSQCLIKRFPNNHKRYSSHLQVSILPQVAPVNVYYESLKNSYLKKVFLS